MRKSFLFLQGSCSHFFMRLADALVQDGHEVRRLVFNAGDVVYWGRRPTWHFRSDGAQLREFLAEKLSSGRISDLVMHGDSRLLHKEALALAESLGLRVHVFEEGYFRPNWITLERGGINGRSRLPRDPDWYRDVGEGLSDPGGGVGVKNPFWLLALHEVTYHLPNLTNYVLYPGYRTHRPQVSALEFVGWGRRYLQLPLLVRQDEAKIRHLVESGQPFFFLPLQLDSDSQIIEHSPFANVAQVIEKVMASFALHGPAGAYLVIKNHPHDTGWSGFPGLVKRLSREFCIQDRVVYLETGHLPTLLNHTLGVVTVNSTVGTSSLIHRRPTKVLGNAIYDLPGLTFQGSLDEFWLGRQKPDMKLLTAFRKVVVHKTQINGGLYSSHGINLGVDNAMMPLLAKKSPLEELL